MQLAPLKNRGFINDDLFDSAYSSRNLADYTKLMLIDRKKYIEDREIELSQNGS